MAKSEIQEKKSFFSLQEYSLGKTKCQTSQEIVKTTKIINIEDTNTFFVKKEKRISKYAYSVIFFLFLHFLVRLFFNGNLDSSSTVLSNTLHLSCFICFILFLNANFKISVYFSICKIFKVITEKTHEICILSTKECIKYIN